MGNWNPFHKDGKTEDEMAEKTEDLNEEIVETAESVEGANTPEEADEAGAAGGEDFVEEAEQLPAEEEKQEEELACEEPSFAEEETALQNVASGQLSFNEQVLEKIASLALLEVGGVLAATSGGGFFNLKSSKGVEIQIQDNQDVIVNLEVILEYGKSAPDVYAALKHSISARIYRMTGLKVREVNVRVLNVLTAEEFNGKN